MNTTTIASWLLTYLLHSTVLLSVAFVISRLLGEKHLALQETLLRAALVGGLITASLQVGLRVEPTVGVFHIIGVDQGNAVTTDIPGSTGPSAAAHDTTTVATPVFTGILENLKSAWPVLLLLLWGAGMLLSLCKLGRSVLDLRRLLTTRHFHPADRLFNRLARIMGLRRPVLLSTSRAIAMPFATGIRNPEVCCPERVNDLALEHQEGLYAHELAHLARRDPSWQLIYRLGEAVLCLQPLNRAVRSRLEEVAEHLTDDRAVACTGDHLGLARCLVVMAHWGTGPQPGLPAAAFASGPRLDRRIGRLLERRSTSRAESIWVVPLAGCFLIACALTLPAVGSLPANAGTIFDVSGPQPTMAACDADETPAPSATPEHHPQVPNPPALNRAATQTSKAPELPAVPVVPEPSPALPHPVALSAPVTAPAPSGALPCPAAAPAPVEAPVREAVPLTEAPSTPEAAPAPPAEVPSASADKPPAPPAPETDTPSQGERSREEERSRRREAEGERATAEARAREQARRFAEEARAIAAEAREFARESADERALAVAERERTREETRELVEKARSEARALSRMASEQAREQAERAREVARETADRARVSTADRDEARSRAEAQRAAQRAQIREMAERARRLAQEAEAERRAAEERQHTVDE